MGTTSEIGHEHAQRVIGAVVSRLVEAGQGAAVAVVDSHGELVAFLKTDGCPLPSVNNAIHKAFTAARERVDSGTVGERSRTDGFPMTNYGDLRYTAWGGGVPIVSDGVVIGGVGVSGLPEASDVELARFGATVG
jgi:glc operon protein GlcG